MKAKNCPRSIPILLQDTDAKFAETEYYFENDLRKVAPYHFTFTTQAKGKWVGNKLCDVFSREFRTIKPKEYAKCIVAGLIRVNDKTIGVDYTVQNKDIISHMVHRHELPVSAKKIDIIKEDDDWVVVDKPGSIHVHPCGKYRHNSILFILAKEHGLNTLWPVHRLDRLTSGVLIFSKSSAKAREMEQLINAREVVKEYVCHVLGEFPAGEIVCEEPITVISIGLSAVDPAGKSCKTTFQRLKFKDGVSIVKCLPKTGRMHQIRVHLQFLGFPISNDPLYNCQEIFGQEKGKGGNFGKSREELVEDYIKHNNADENRVESNEYEMEPHSQETDHNSQSNLYYDPHCSECKVPSKDPSPSSLVMFLHALKYSGDGWSYQTELPHWAKL